MRIDGVKVLFRLAENTPDDSHQFCKIYNGIYSRKINTDYYHWQFFSTPFPAYLVFAEFEGCVVGSLGVHVKTLMPCNKRVLSIIDMMVTPDFRGKQVFRNLVESSFLFGRKYAPIAGVVMANLAGKKAICSRLAWTCVSELETEQLILTEQNSVATRIAKNDIAQRIITNWPSILSCTLTHTRHDNSYYHWRFRLHPFYRYYTCGDGNTLYSVLKLFEDPITHETYGDIIEIYGVNEKCIREAATRSLDLFYSLGVLKVTTWLQTNTMWDEIGKDFGFLDTGTKRYFCMYILDDDYNILKDPRHWLLQLSDTEIY